MNLAGNTILLTGGASGIGFAFAERLHAHGSHVIIVGRRADKLREAQQRLRGLLTYQADLSQPSERVALAAWVSQEHPQLNVLVNNAGVLRRLAVADLGISPEAWEQARQELAINLEAPLHLAALLLPQLQGRTGATIINISSGLAFTPWAAAPVYSATKAALHSFSMSLRYQAAQVGVTVVEIVPPIVQTDLASESGLPSGEPVAAFADGVLTRLAAGETEIGYGSAEVRRLASRPQLDAYFRQLNP
jgi:uncharacterized oxidoreductase